MKRKVFELAVIETWYNQDLKQPVKVHYLNGNVFSQDNAGNLIGVNVFDGDNPATLSGSVSASVIRADGATVAVSGVLSGNKCSVTLPQSCYSVPGLISVVVKLTSGSTITTVCAVVANVYRSSTDTVVDPGEIIPSVQELIAEIEAAVESIPVDYSAINDALLCKGIFDKDTISEDRAINTSNGTIYPASGYYTSAFIKVVPGMTIIASLNGLPSMFNFLATYDDNSTFVNCYTSVNERFTIPVGVGYIRVCNSTSGRPPEQYKLEYDFITAYINRFSLLKNGNIFANEHYVILDNGNIQYNAGYVNFDVSDMIPVVFLAGITIRNAPIYSAAQVNCLAFYDKDYQLIGTPYIPADYTSGLVPVDITITPSLVGNYPGAVYCRIGSSKEFGTTIVSYTEKEQIENQYPSFKVNAYPKIIFCGDSVTEGFVCEGTQDNPQTIYEVLPNQSYPACFGRIYAGAEIAKVAQSGITPLNYYAQKYPNIDFSEYGIVIVELGLNGGLDVNDINTENTNTWALKKIVEGIRTQNPDAQIGLVRSQYYLTTANAVSAFNSICSSYDCIYIDLHKTKYLDLADPKYHGYYNDGGTAKIDYAHFTRRGYAAKAFVVAKMLGELLP